jgi:hypothetical protein
MTDPLDEPMPSGAEASEQIQQLACLLGTCLGALLIGLAAAGDMLPVSAVGALLIYASALSLGYTAGSEEKLSATSQDKDLPLS